VMEQTARMERQDLRAQQVRTESMVRTALPGQQAQLAPMGLPVLPEPTVPMERRDPLVRLAPMGSPVQQVLLEQTAQRVRRARTVLTVRMVQRVLPALMVLPDPRALQERMERMEPMEPQALPAPMVQRDLQVLRD